MPSVYPSLNHKSPTAPKEKVQSGSRGQAQNRVKRRRKTERDSIPAVVTGSTRVNVGLGAQVVRLEFSQENKHRLYTSVTVLMVVELVVAVTNNYGPYWLCGCW